VISHDEQYFEVGDRIIKLDFGQIVENLQREDLKLPDRVVS
jgi:ABC-type siderophore export system fused ATPase/permease subunit